MFHMEKNVYYYACYCSLIPFNLIWKPKHWESMIDILNVELKSECEYLMTSIKDDGGSMSPSCQY